MTPNKSWRKTLTASCQHKHTTHELARSTRACALHSSLHLHSDLSTEDGPCASSKASSRVDGGCCCGWPIPTNQVVNLQGSKGPCWSDHGTVVVCISIMHGPLLLCSVQGKWVVFFFYPLDFTFVCPTEITAFNDRAEEFAAIGTEVIAASVDSQYVHLAWCNTPRKQGGLGPMKIPLVADGNHRYEWSA